jgi:MFS family permease
MVATIQIKQATTPAAVNVKGNIHAFASSWLGETFDAMDATIYFIALFPALSELLKTTDATAIGWHGALILAIFMVGWSIGSIFFGMIADKFGRKQAMVWSILLYAGASVLCAMAQSWQELAFYRFLVGWGIGGEISLGCVLLAEAWQGKGKLWSLCLMQTSFSAGCLLTSAFNFGLGGGWRGLFLVGLIPAVVAWYIRSHIEEPEAFRTAQLARKFSKASLMEPMKLLAKSGYLSRVILTTVLCGVAIIGYWASISWMPAWINQITGTEAVAERSMATLMMSIGGLIACGTCPLLAKWFGRKGAYLIGFIGSLVTVPFMFLAVKTYGPLLLGASFMVGVLATLPFVVSCFYIPEIFPTRMLATASGISWSVGRLGAAAAGLATGPIIAMFNGSYAYAATCISMIYIFGIIASFYVREPKESQPLDLRNQSRPTGRHSRSNRRLSHNPDRSQGKDEPAWTATES